MKEHETKLKGNLLGMKGTWKKNEKRSLFIASLMNTVLLEEEEGEGEKDEEEE